LPPINNHLLEAETKQSNYVKSMFIYLAMWLQIQSSTFTPINKWLWIPVTLKTGYS
jgi:hypothetical protein